MRWGVAKQRVDQLFERARSVDMAGPLAVARSQPAQQQADDELQHMAELLLVFRDQCHAVAKEVVGPAVKLLAQAAAGALARAG